MNSLNAIGNISADAELRYLPNSTEVVQFNFALSSGYGDKQVTTWLRCSLFGKRAETLAPMLTKGTKIGITGELTNRPYTDKNGNEKYSLEVRVSDITLLGKKDGVTSSASQTTARPDEQDKSPMGGNFDDDIPFSNPYKGRICYVV